MTSDRRSLIHSLDCAGEQVGDITPLQDEENEPDHIG